MSQLGMIDAIQKLMIVKLAKSLSMGDEGLLDKMIERAAWDSVNQFQNSIYEHADYVDLDKSVARVAKLLGSTLECTGLVK